MIYIAYSAQVQDRGGPFYFIYRNSNTETYTWVDTLIDPLYVEIESKSTQTTEQWLSNFQEKRMVLLGTISDSYTFSDFKQDHPELFI